MNNKDTFRFFIPIQNFEKATDGKGKKVMKIKGIASTSDEDTDGEFMDPNGFELDYFTDFGFLNWHHQVKNNPLAIIGEPTKATIKDNQLHVEGVLYPDNPLANQVYELGEMLQKSSEKRRLGFSIEGKVLERDDLRPKYVKKAKITGLAVTPTPKNAQTLAEIVKGEFSDDEVEYETVNTDSSNGGTVLIIDITRPTGERVTVDKDFNIKIYKALDTTSGAALRLEHVDGSTKNLVGLQKSVEKHLGRNKKVEIFKADFLQSELIDQILDKTNDLNKAEEVFKLIKFAINKEDMEKSENNLVITPEAIEKAFAILNLKKSEESGSVQPSELDLLIKAKDEKTAELAEIDKKIKAKKAEEDESSEEGKKVEDEDEEDETEKGKKKDDSEKPDDKKVPEKIEETFKAEGDFFRKIKKSEDGKEDYADDKKYKKDGDKYTEVSPEDVEKMEKAKKEKKEETIEKGENNELLKSILDSFKKSDEKYEAIGVILKGVSDQLTETNEQLQIANERIEALEAQPVGRKSVKSQHYVEKSFSNQFGQGEGGRELSVSRDKGEILNLLETKSNLEKGENVDMQMANAMSLFETSGVLPGAIIARLAKEEKVIITK